MHLGGVMVLYIHIYVKHVKAHTHSPPQRLLHRKTSFKVFAQRVAQLYKGRRRAP